MPDQLFRLAPSEHVDQIRDVLVAAPGEPSAPATELNAPAPGNLESTNSGVKEFLVAHLAQLGADLDRERDTLAQLHADISLRKQSRYLNKASRPPGTLASDLKNLSKAQQRLAAIGLFVSLFARPHNSRDPFSWLSPEADALRMLGKRSLGWSPADALALWAAWSLVDCRSSYHQGLATEFPLLVSEQALAARPTSSTLSASAATPCTDGVDATAEVLGSRVRDYLRQVHAWFPATAMSGEVEALRHRVSVLAAGLRLPDSVCDIREAFGAHARNVLTQAHLLEPHTGLLVHLASWDKGPTSNGSAAWCKTLDTHLATDSGSSDAPVAGPAHEVLIVLAESALVSIDHIGEDWHSGVHWFPTATRRLLWGTCAALGTALAAGTTDHVNHPASTTAAGAGDGTVRGWAERAETALAQLAAFCLSPEGRRGRPRCEATASAALAALRNAGGACAMPLLDTVSTTGLSQAVLTTLTQLRAMWAGADAYPGPVVPSYELSLAAAAVGVANAAWEMAIEHPEGSTDLAAAVITLSVADGARCVFLDATQRLVDPRQVTKTPAQMAAVRAATNAVKNIETSYESEVSRLTAMAAAAPLPVHLWQRHLVEHPISGVVAAGLLWEASCDDGTVIVGLPAPAGRHQAHDATAPALWCLDTVAGPCADRSEPLGLVRVGVPATAQVRLWHPATTAAPESHGAWLRHYFRDPWPQPLRQLASASLAPEQSRVAAAPRDVQMCVDGDWAGVQGLRVCLSDVAAGVAASWWDVPGGVWSAPAGSAELVLRLPAAGYRARVALLPAADADTRSRGHEPDAYLDSSGVSFGPLSFDYKTSSNRWEPVCIAEVTAEVMSVTLAEFGQFLLCCLGPHVSTDYYLMSRVALKTAPALAQASGRSSLLTAAAESRAELVEAFAWARMLASSRSGRDTSLFGDPLGVVEPQLPLGARPSTAPVAPVRRVGTEVEVVRPVGQRGTSSVVVVDCLTGKARASGRSSTAVEPAARGDESGRVEEDRPTVLAAARMLASMLTTSDKAMLFFFSDVLDVRP